MAKLTADEWQYARAVWEADEREGYAWLVKELDLPVSDSAVRKKAKSQQWEKGAELSDELLAEKLQKDGGNGGSIPPGGSDGSDDGSTDDGDDGPGTGLVVGRPSKYRHEYNEVARRMFLLWKDCTDEKLGEVLGVCERTIHYWKQQYPEFLQSVRKGKELADAEVANGMYTRAVGYDADTETVVVVDGKIIIQNVKRHFPPDVSAAKFWLMNRQPEHWPIRSQTC